MGLENLMPVRELNQAQIESWGPPEHGVANFGALDYLLPPGYVVVYLDSGHSVGMTPEGEQFVMHWNRWESFRWCREHGIGEGTG